MIDRFFLKCGIDEEGEQQFILVSVHAFSIFDDVNSDSKKKITEGKKLTKKIALCYLIRSITNRRPARPRDPSTF